MLTTIATILPVFLIILAGYALARTKILPPESAQILNSFVIWIPLPCLMFHLVATTDWARQWDNGFVIASLGGSLAIFLIGMVVGRWRGLSVTDMAVDGLNASYANAAYIGLPLLTLALFVLSVATGMIGLIVVFPWLGHATWHAWRAVR